MINVNTQSIPAKNKDKDKFFSRFAFPLWGFLLLTVSAVLLVYTLDDMGMTDDDDFYVPAGKDYITWVERAVKGALDGDFSEFRKNRIDRYWRNNHEHPSIAKLAIGAGWLVFHKWLGLFGEIDGARMGVILFSLLLIYLIFRFSWEIFGPRAAIFAVLAFLTMPRSFYHCHVPTLDIPIATTMFLVVYAAWRAERSRLWIVIAGLLYGVAMCTKLNGPFVVFPLLVYWFYRWRQAAVLRHAATLTFRRMFSTGLSMAFLSFPIFWLLWPWIWNDPIGRLIGYFNFHFHHYGIRLLYFGEVFLKPFAPWHAPFVYAALTIPVVTLLFGLWGFGRGARQLAPSNLKSFPYGPGSRDDYALLCAANVFFAIAIVAFPDNPKYGGVKLFQPLYPFFAVLAGYGFELFIQRTATWKPALRRSLNRYAFAAGLLLLLPGIIASVRVYPYMLSYYNSIAGGPKGAAELGMERQYYDVCYRSMISFWDTNGGHPTRVSYEPNIVEYRRTYPWYKRDGKLRRDVTIDPPERADYMVLTHERRWSHYQELLHQYRGKTALHTEKTWGLPLYTVYELKKSRISPVKTKVPTVKPRPKLEPDNPPSMKKKKNGIDKTRTIHKARLRPDRNK